MYVYKNLITTRFKLNLWTANLWKCWIIQNKNVSIVVKSGVNNIKSSFYKACFISCVVYFSVMHVLYVCDTVGFDLCHVQSPWFLDQK